MITCYKSFKKGLIDREGKKYEIGKLYKTKEKIVFDKTGFHMYKNIEDALMFSEANRNEESVVCEVLGYGLIEEEKSNRDTIYGTMYATSDMVIERILDREEIIKDMYSVVELRFLRYLLALKLSENEINLIEDKYKNNQSILDHIAYYQKNDKDVYIRRYKK